MGEFAQRLPFTVRSCRFATAVIFLSYFSELPCLCLKIVSFQGRRLSQPEPISPTRRLSFRADQGDLPDHVPVG